MEMPKIVWSKEKIKEQLDLLEPSTPWAHYFNLDGIETINKEKDEKYYKKSHSRSLTGELAITILNYHARNKQMNEMRFLDIASAEGVHSIRFAVNGAKEVIGVEGRQLYVDRATLIANAFGLENVKFKLGDVRKLTTDEFGQFDFINCCGLLHHLGHDDFVPFIQSLSELCCGILFLDIHVANPATIERFRLTKTNTGQGELDGALFREHKDGATESDKAKKVRASLDNTFSFWPTEELLLKTLKESGFNFISKIMHPHVHSGYDNRINRPFYIAIK